jgi:hypothetical protein
MPFSLDTSGLLDAWVRYYPPDVFPTVWSHMEIAAKRGEIVIIDEVADEPRRAIIYLTHRNFWVF